MVALLGGIEARRELSDPHSLLNRPPVIYFKGVTGAPGDGNTSLSSQMKQRLPNLGEVMQDTAKGADYTLAGEIKTAPGANNTTPAWKSSGLWTTSPANERGPAWCRSNEVPLHSLDSYWGDVAVTVATEAAGRRARGDQPGQRPGHRARRRGRARARQGDGRCQAARRMTLG